MPITTRSGFAFLVIAFWMASLPGGAFAQSTATRQRLFDTIPFIPEHGIQRLEQFHAEPLTRGRTVFLGNSITEMGDWKKLTGDSTVLNRGIGGDITFSLFKRLDEVIRHQPSRIFLLIGINDIGKDIPDAVIVENILRITTLLKDAIPGTKILVQSILPLNPEIPNFPQHYDKQEHVLNTNRLLSEACKRNGIDFINIHDLFTDGKGRLDERFTADGLHLKPGGEGYAKWVAYLRSKGYL
jgi:lysophospholipase L1-like esterase